MFAVRHLLIWAKGQQYAVISNLPAWTIWLPTCYGHVFTEVACPAVRYSFANTVGDPGNISVDFYLFTDSTVDLQQNIYRLSNGSANKYKDKSGVLVFFMQIGLIYYQEISKVS